MGYINPSGKVLRYPERIATLRRGEFFPPVGVEIDLTNRCNLGCKFCHFGYTHTRGFLAGTAKLAYESMGDEMDFGLLTRVLPEMHKAGVKSITYTGGGEPTLYPRFIEALERAYTVLDIGLYTNGTLIDDKKANAIKQMCKWVVVSLDEPYRDAYSAIKQSDKFTQAREGVKRLVKAKGDCVVGVSFLVSGHHTKTDLRRMWELGNELGADYTEYRPRIIFDEANPSVASEDTAWANQAMQWLEEINGYHVKADARVEQFKLYADYSRPYGVCYGILFTGIITPNGKMWKCVNRRGFPDSCIGDLNEQSFIDVWMTQKPHTDFEKCRVLCRADVMNRALWNVMQPIPHETFI